MALERKRGANQATEVAGGKLNAPHSSVPLGVEARVLGTSLICHGEPALAREGLRRLPGSSTLAWHLQGTAARSSSAAGTLPWVDISPEGGKVHTMAFDGG